MDVAIITQTMAVMGIISNNTGITGINITAVEMMIRILMIIVQISLIQFNGPYINS